MNIDWETIASIILSGIISWVISAIYFYRGNRESLKMAVLSPMLDILIDGVSKENYSQIKELSRSYLTRFLTKDEKKKLYDLTSKYKFVSTYNESKANATAVMEDFENRLKNGGINPKIVPLEIDGEIIDYDYPDEINYMHDELLKIFELDDLQGEIEEYKEVVLRYLKLMTKKLYTKEIGTIFENYNLEQIIKNALITDKWNWKFERYKTAKKEFEDLKIIKSLKKIKGID